MPVTDGSIHFRIGVDHPYAANTFLTIVRKVFNWGGVATLLPSNYRNPVKGIVFLPKGKRMRFVTRAEMPRLLQAVEYEPKFASA